MVSIGIEQLASSPSAELTGKKLALLCNQASTDRNFVHTRDIVEQTYPGQLACLFSPQHGFFSEKQDNMVESGNSVDAVSGLPVYSLYAEDRKPDPALFDTFDILLIDLIDVGTRVYTFIWTVVYCLQTAVQTGTKVVLLDRPNPIGGHLVEGNLLKEEWFSFVGLHAIPMRHGLTIGELALLCNQEMAINADLEIIRVKGWHRNMFGNETVFPWVFPSPNMPTVQAAMVYPGQVIWEGTNISEGRGTTMPFLLCGAPFIQHKEVFAYLEKTPLPGCILRPLVFEPTSGKWDGHPCKGFQIHVTDAESYRPYRTSLALLQAMLHLYPDQFTYKDPPYEYEYEKLPLDLIIGNQQVRLAIEEGLDIVELEEGWREELEDFKERCAPVFLYDEG